MTAALAAALAFGSAQAAPYAYMTGPAEPWGSTANARAMDAAFGAGNWRHRLGFGLWAFAPDTRFVFLDGGDQQAPALRSFLAEHGVYLRRFVAGGGHLFVNAGPNIGGSFPLGFGATLNHAQTLSGTAWVTPAGAAAGLLAGGLTAEYRGSAFAHAAIAGGGTTLVQGTAGPVLAVREYGEGRVMFGGQTATDFHIPGGPAFALRVNQLRFGAEGAMAPGIPIPAPGAAALLGVGLVGLAALRRGAQPPTLGSVSRRCSSRAKRSVIPAM